MINSVWLHNFVLALCRHVARTYFFRCLSLPLMRQVDDLTAQVEFTPSGVDLPRPSSLPVTVSCSSLYITLWPHLWCCTSMWTCFMDIVYLARNIAARNILPPNVKVSAVTKEEFLFIVETDYNAFLFSRLSASEVWGKSTYYVQCSSILWTYWDQHHITTICMFPWSAKTALREKVSSPFLQANDQEEASSTGMSSLLNPEVPVSSCHMFFRSTRFILTSFFPFSLFLQAISTEKGGLKASSSAVPVSFCHDVFDLYHSHLEHA